MKILTGDELEKAHKRHVRRRQIFEQEGLSKEDAYDLAEAMLDRDLSDDDRRLCFECDNYSQKTKICRAIRNSDGRFAIPVRFVLQRCEKFKLIEVKK
jgi:hypothetical protein